MIAVTEEIQGPPTVIEAYRPFPMELLPTMTHRYVAESADSIGCDPAYVALPLLAALAAAIGATRVVELKRGWNEPPILWTAVIGESGSHKTPAQRQALYGIRKIETRLNNQFDEVQQLHEEELAQHEEKKRQWRKVKNGPPPTEPQPPTLQRIICGDTTVEALGGLLADNPRGLLLARDELSGWIGSFNAYKAGAGDESQWLELHQGNAITIDRKTGTTPLIHVPRTSLSLTGGIQPGILRDSFGKAKFDSGLVARFLMAYPPARAKHWRNQVLGDDTKDAMGQVFEGLFALSADADGEPLIVPLSSEALDAFVVFYNEHGAEQAELSGALASAWSKLEAYAARFALVIHETRVAEDDQTIEDSSVVDVVSITAGITLARWFGYETKRIYATLHGSASSMHWHKLAEVLRRHNGQIRLRDLARGHYSGQRVADIRSQIRPYIEDGWIEVVQIPTGGDCGRPSEGYRLTDTVTHDKTPDGEP